MSCNPWECPRCHAINAPFTAVCFCKPDVYKTSTGTAPFNPMMVAHCQICGAMLNGLTKHYCKITVTT